MPDQRPRQVSEATFWLPYQIVLPVYEVLNPILPQLLLLSSLGRLRVGLEKSLRPSQRQTKVSGTPHGDQPVWWPCPLWHRLLFTLC